MREDYYAKHAFLIFLSMLSDFSIYANEDATIYDMYDMLYICAIYIFVLYYMLRLFVIISGISVT